ncbi:hypothetical protein [Massilia endophytica]|uniref:hypothetical protein n=1 Tax=Massilia endophytica TaxID=2899220 RepID=UPI001E2F0B15|nr:hypothetical protein [Massilia endophytica]UGQ45082.1 hypothetical protein LSQ66_14910 [Massilia endophytica]
MTTDTANDAGAAPQPSAATKSVVLQPGLRIAPVAVEPQVGGSFKRDPETGQLAAATANKIEKE